MDPRGKINTWEKTNTKYCNIQVPVPPQCISFTWLLLSESKITIISGSQESACQNLQAHFRNTNYFKMWTAQLDRKMRKEGRISIEMDQMIKNVEIKADSKCSKTNILCIMKRTEDRWIWGMLWKAGETLVHHVQCYHRIRHLKYIYINIRLLWLRTEHEQSRLMVTRCLTRDTGLVFNSLKAKTSVPDWEK